MLLEKKVEQENNLSNIKKNIKRSHASHNNNINNNARITTTTILVSKVFVQELGPWDLSRERRRRSVPYWMD